ncbi:hypothetical protein MG293_014273 [Ovis ammon polii]|uniref:Uncharacterized protein n=1 Tax=Ovis ammon polii TaxID=230172 RepID=A0AAD4Y737_OVIAM|nr:hypothetical protein MG293_014273 [Ovis ammon polii]
MRASVLEETAPPAKHVLQTQPSVLCAMVMLFELKVALDEAFILQSFLLVPKQHQKFKLRTYFHIQYCYIKLIYDKMYFETYVRVEELESLIGVTQEVRHVDTSTGGEQRLEQGTSLPGDGLLHIFLTGLTQRGQAAVMAETVLGSVGQQHWSRFEGLSFHLSANSPGEVGGCSPPGDDPLPTRRSYGAREPAGESSGSPLSCWREEAGVTVDLSVLNHLATCFSHDPPSMGVLGCMWKNEAPLFLFKFNLNVPWKFTHDLRAQVKKKNIQLESLSRKITSTSHLKFRAKQSLCIWYELRLFSVRDVASL